MASPAEIAQNAAYIGSAPLGGAEGGPITFDAKPLENLAFYTMSYNKMKYDENKKATDEKIKEVSDLSKISLNDLRGKDKEQATGEFNKLLTYANEYARKIPSNNQQRLTDELDWQTKLGAFNNNYGSGKTRALSYQAQLNKINSEITDAKQKEVAIASLNKKFDSTDIGTPISAMEDFKIDKIDVPKPNAQVFDTIGVGPNAAIETTASIFNPTANLPAADAAVLGMRKVYKKGTPEYEALSDLEKQQADQQNASTSTGKIWADMAEPLNAVLKKYVREDGSLDETRFEEENASNQTVMNAYNAIKNLRNYSNTKKQEIQSGVFTDKGTSVKAPPNIKPTDFNAGIVDWKNVTPNQLVLAGMYAQYDGDKFQKKFIQTDNALQKEKNAIDWAKLGLDKDEFGLKQKQFEASQKGSSTQINGATERAKRIYADLVNIAGGEGKMITPDKINKLNVEQLKYLGIEQPEQRNETGKIIGAGGFKPLDLSGKQYAIQLKDGNINILAPKEGDVNIDFTEDKSKLIGSFDQTKSTNIFNVATNILNEELKNAGSKELSSYWGVDVTNAPTQTTDVKTSSTKSNSNNLSTDSKDWKKEGNNWRYKDGTLYDDKGNIIK